MGRRQEILLCIDGAINLMLGMLLLLFPFGTAELLGVQKPDSSFYPTILGGVIVGIGVALLIERYGYAHNIRGLGLQGAVVINVCGALILLAWLILHPFTIPLRGHIILWSIAAIVVLLTIIELLAKGRYHNGLKRN